MQYLDGSEFVVNNIDSDGITINRMISQAQKSSAGSQLLGHMKNFVRTIDDKLTYSSFWPFVAGRLPVHLNNLAQMYHNKKVLVVGHYDRLHQHNFMNGDLHDPVPMESVGLTEYMNYNTCYQFIPLLNVLYEYNLDFTLARPPEERYTSLMTYLYNQYSIDYQDCNKQYKHGSTSWELQDENGTPIVLLPEEKYDAVLFLGVPKKYDNTEFTSSDIKSQFADYCKPDFEIYDIYYSAEDELRFTDRENRKDMKPIFTKSFSTRAEWDSSMNDGRTIHWNAYNRNTRVF